MNNLDDVPSFALYIPRHTTVNLPVLAARLSFLLGREKWNTINSNVFDMCTDTTGEEGGYGGGIIFINEEVYSTSMVATQFGIPELWNPAWQGLPRVMVEDFMEIFYEH